jgi:hypothetical protein
MPNESSPSPIIGCFVRAVERELPSSESAKLAAHQAAIARTTSKGDAHRARRCAEWAITMADDKDQAHPRWRELKELHRVWQDTWFGVHFGGLTNESRIEDVKIQWTEDAVAVAKGLGEEDGWDRSPWEGLLVELIGIDTPHASD